jgi:predicted transcriptional regulator
MMQEAHTMKVARSTTRPGDAHDHHDVHTLPPHTALLEFFKALSDANRLKLVGVLAHGPRTVEDLAASLDLDSSTVSHHLARLARVGLVRAEAEGPYSVYALDRDALQGLARNLLADDVLPRLAGDADLGAFDRKVLTTFTDEEGRFTGFPSQRKKYLVLVRHTLRAFEPGAEYDEAEVNSRLARFHDDTARLRRSLVDFGFMGRTRSGDRYWLLPG